MAMENGSFINDFPIKVIKTSTHRGFSLAKDPHLAGAARKYLT